MLYIVLLLVATFVGWSYIKAKARVHHARQVRAIREFNDMANAGTLDRSVYPSWISNKNRLREFVIMVGADVKRKGVPDSFFLKITSNINDRSQLMIIAGIMEKNRSSFKEQAMAASDIVIQAWSKERMNF